MDPKTTDTQTAGQASALAPAPCSAFWREACNNARKKRLNRGLLALSSWARSRAMLDHDSSTTLTMLERKASELRIAVDQAGWDAVAAANTKVSVGVDAWFDVLDAAGKALHNMQYPLRELELPPYPAGGTCGCANLGKALSHIGAAQEAIRDLEKQLGEWCAMNASAHGSSPNENDEPRP